MLFGKALMKFPKILGLVLLLGVFFWSCEEGSDNSGDENLNELGLGSYLNDAKTLYTFYIDSFIQSNEVVYNVGNVNDRDDILEIDDIWDGVNVRWGFRRKPANAEQETKIYWWQKSNIDLDTQNVYETETSELEKAYFTPTALPAALLSEDAIEVYAVLEIGGYKIAQAYDLPADFKTRVLGSSVVEGLIVNGDAVKAGRSPSYVEAAAVFAIHKSTGAIFQSFSDESGRYRVTVNGKGNFSLVVLRNGFQPRILDKTITSSLSGMDITINELAPGVRIVPRTLYEIGTASALSTLSASGYNASGTSVDVSNGVKGVPGAFLLFYDRAKDEASFLQTDSAGSFSLNLPLDPSVKEDERTTLSVLGAAYGYVAQRGSEVIGAPNSASTLLGAVEFVEDETVRASTELAWGPRSTGGPSNFSKESPIKLHYPNGGIEAKMYLIATGTFVPAGVNVVWQIDGSVVSGENGMSATLPLRSEKKYTVSAGFTDSRQNKVLLERSFDLDSSYSTDADDPVIVFGDDTIRGGSLDGEDTDGDGNSRINIDPDNSENPAVSVVPSVQVIDPDTGDDEGLLYDWAVNGKPAGNGASPDLPLEPGVNTVTLTVTSKDGENSVTTSRIYLVGAEGDGTNGGDTGGTDPTDPDDEDGESTITLGANSLDVSFGYGSSGGVISSGNLGSKTNPLSYSTKGSNQFTVSLKALVDGATTGALSYEWSIQDVVTDAVIPEPSGTTRTQQLETFSLQAGSYAIVVKVTDGSGRSGKASRAFKIVAESSVQLPAGTTGEWLASSSGGAGDLPDDSDKTTFKDEGGRPVAVRVSTDVSDPLGNTLTPMEWYVDGVLQEGIASLDTLLQLPSGGGSAPVTRVVLGVGRGSGTNEEPVTMRRVFTLNPAVATSPLGPVVRWDTSSLEPSATHNFNGNDPVQLIVAVVATSPGSPVFSYAWTLNGSLVAGQTARTAVLNLNRAGVNTVSVKVSNSGGSSELERDYTLNNLPVVSVTLDKAGAVIGENVQVTADVTDADGGTFTYSWKIKGSASTLWESIPGLDPQPSTSTFSLPTTGLKADTYAVQVTVNDRGASVTGEASFVLNASSGGPEIEWGTSSLDPTKTHSFDSTTGLVLNLGVSLLNAEAGETYTYEWRLNNAVIASATGNSLTQNLSQAGTNVVNVKVSNSKGSAVLERSYILNTLPKVTLFVSEDSVVAGKAVTAIAAPSDPDAGTTFSFVWKLQRPGETTWIDIPNVAKQPSFAAFELLTTGFASGVYKLQVTVSDGMGGSVAVEDTFSIAANSLPTLGEIQLPPELSTGGVYEVNSPTPISKTGTFSIVGSDPDGDPLTYTWRINGYLVSRGSTPNAVIDFGTPPAVNSADPSVRVISVEAEDPEGGRIVKSVTIRVNHLPTATINVGTETGSGTIPVSATVIDEDLGNTFTYVWKLQRPGETTWIDIPNMATQPTGANFDLPLTGLTTGIYKLQLKVSDDRGGSTTVESDVSIVVNRAPTVSVSSRKSGGATIVTAVATDPDGDPLTYVWKIRQGTGAWTDIPDMNPQPTGSSFTLPTSLADGTYEIQVTVGDGTNNIIKVTNVVITSVPNRAPEASISSARSDGATVVTATATDPDGDPLTYVWKIRQGTGAWGNIPGLTPQPTGPSFTLPTSLADGAYDIQLTVSDGTDSVIVEDDVTISSTNQAPVVYVTSDRTGGNIVVTANANDPEGDPLTYAWEMRPQGSNVWGNIAGLNPQPTGSSFTLPPTTSDGVYEVRVKVNDGTSDVAADTIVRVGAVSGNQAPVVSLSSSGSTIVATASDPDGDTLFYLWLIRLKGAQTWGGITGNPTTPSITLPSNLADGDYEVRVNVNDGTVTSSAEIDIRVGSANRAPTMIGVSSASSRETTVVTASASDPDGDTLTYLWQMRLQGASAWGPILGLSSQPSTASFTLPTTIAAGTYEIQAKASDGIAESGTAQTVVTLTTGSGAAAISLTLSDFDASEYVDMKAVVSNVPTGVSYDRFEWTFNAPGSNAWNPLGASDFVNGEYIRSSAQPGEISVPASALLGVRGGNKPLGDYLVRVTAIGSDGNALSAETRFATLVKVAISSYTLKNFIFDIEWSPFKYISNYSLRWGSRNDNVNDWRTTPTDRMNFVELDPGLTRYQAPILDDSNYAFFIFEGQASRARTRVQTVNISVVGRTSIVQNND